jgi:hypothetical protein
MSSAYIANEGTDSVLLDCYFFGRSEPVRFLADDARQVIDVLRRAEVHVGSLFPKENLNATDQ